MTTGQSDCHWHEETCVVVYRYTRQEETRHISVYQVQPSRRSEVRGDRAGDGDRLTSAPRGSGQRPYTQTHLPFRKPDHFGTLGIFDAVDFFVFLSPWSFFKDKPFIPVLFF